MNDAEIAALIVSAGSDEIGESLMVIASRPYCRISLVARNQDHQTSLFVEAVVKYDLRLTTTELGFRRGLLRRLGSLGFTLVQENGSKVYERKVCEEEVKEVIASLLKR
jgi:hypothetical protein